MYACEDGKWRECTIQKAKEDGTVMIQKLINAEEKVYSSPFCIPHTKLESLEKDMIGKDHNIKEITESSNGKDSTMALIFQKILHSVQNTQTNDYTERLFYGSQLGKFTHRFPETEGEFYSWITHLDAFESKHTNLPPDMIFKKVVESLKGQNNVAWRNYRTKKYREHITSSEQEDTPNARVMYMKQHIDNMQTLQTFAIKEIQVQPDISHFQAKCAEILAKTNEKASDSLAALEQFWFEFEVLRQKINPCISRKLRAFQVMEKLEAIQRLLITQNNSEIYGNKGVLNAKVKTKLSTKLEKLQQENDDPDDRTKDAEMYQKVVQYIKEELTNAILPSLDEVQSEDGKHWVRYNRNSSVFTTAYRNKSKRSKSQSKRERVGAASSPTKRAKYDRADAPKCPEGIHCRWILSRKPCYKRHTRKEMKAMRSKLESAKFVKRVLQDSATSPSDQRPKRDRTDSTRYDRPLKRQRMDRDIDADKSKGRSSRCKHGQKCTYWQQGKCNFQHQIREMKCAGCGKVGHPVVACRSKNGPPQNTPARYNVSNPNHSRMMAMYAAPLPNCPPQYYTSHYQMNATPVQSASNSNQRVSEYHQLAITKDLAERAQLLHSTLKKASRLNPW